MGDSTLIEFVRDLVIIIVGTALALWLLVMAAIALALFKKISDALAAVKRTANNVAEGGQALKDSFGGKNPFLGIAAAGVGRALSALVRSAVRRS